MRIFMFVGAPPEAPYVEFYNRFPVKSGLLVIDVRVEGCGKGKGRFTKRPYGNCVNTMKNVRAEIV